MKKLLQCGGALLTFVIPFVGYGGGYLVRVGPPAVGMGQANPVTFTSPAEYEFTFISQSGLEARVALITTGVGTRIDLKHGFSASLGAGLVLNSNGVGPGVYSSFNYRFTCERFCADIDFIQSIGISKKILNPYALRIGVGLWSK